MQLGILSMRYAKALLRFATENGESDRVYTETQTLAQSFICIPALQQSILSPLLSCKNKAELLLTAACGKSEPSDSIKKFIDLIIKNKRLDVLQFAANSYGTLYRKENGLVQSKLVIPTEVSAELLDKFKQIIENRTDSKVDFNIEINPEIKGGFILQYDTYCLDASVRTQLAKIKRKLA